MATHVCIWSIPSVSNLDLFGHYLSSDSVCFVSFFVARLPMGESVL